MKIRRYLEYYFEEKKKGSLRGMLSVDQVSTNLKKELLIDAQYKHLERIPLLIDNFSKEFLEAICL